MVMCFAGLGLGMARKWRPAWFLLIWFATAGFFESLVAIFHFTRFFLILLPPLLIGAGYGALTLMELLLLEKSRGFKTSYVGLGAAFVVLLCAIVVPAGIQIARITSNPAKASLPYEDRHQFITQWPAGWGPPRPPRLSSGRAARGP